MRVSSLSEAHGASQTARSPTSWMFRRDGRAENAESLPLVLWRGRPLRDPPRTTYAASGRLGANPGSFASQALWLERDRLHYLSLTTAVAATKCCRRG